MSKNRPLTDHILCVPSKIKDAAGKSYPGGYPAGLLEDIRRRLFCKDPTASILHMPGGWADHYNNGSNWGYGLNDKKADIDPATEPDFCFDCRKIMEYFKKDADFGLLHFIDGAADSKRGKGTHIDPFDAVLIDRDYDPLFAEKHASGSSTWPNDKEIMLAAKDCFDTVLKPHGVVIIFDKKALTLKGVDYEQIWHVGVTISGGSQDTRVYSVWRRTYDQKEHYPDWSKQ